MESTMAAGMEKETEQQVFGSTLPGASEGGMEPLEYGASEWRQDFNFGWRFKEDGLAGAEAVAFNDSDWRAIRLPHDWSVEHPFDRSWDGATGYLPGGVGWYRKRFVLDLSSQQEAWILFDGIYNHSEVYLNGKKLGYRPYGYAPFYYRLTEHLVEGENVLAVRVDRSRYIDSRWYTGSGIYRNVELVVADKLHVPIWGTVVRTEDVGQAQATVAVVSRIENLSDAEQAYTLRQRVMDPSGEEVAVTSGEKVLAPGCHDELAARMDVESPVLWDIGQGNLYTLVTELERAGEIIQRTETKFGIRTLATDPQKGFFLNGRSIAIKGVCLHHDAGLVGAAVPRGVWKRRLEVLMAGGCNAIRIAHNPGSRELTELCDALGMLVQVEFFDEWDYPKDKRLNGVERHDDYISRGYAEDFQEWCERDLKNTMLRDRNHPSVVMWSIGNEIEWGYPRYKQATGYFDADASGNYFWELPRLTPEQIRQRLDTIPQEEFVLAESARRLADWTRELDTTRPVIANLILPSASHESGYTDALDIVGYSYRRVLYDYCHKLYPDKMIMGTENLPQWHEWKAIQEREFIPGTFFWTGISYLGESHGAWPYKANRSGMLNLAAFEKPSFHMMRTLWQEDPQVYIYSQTAEKSLYEIRESGELPEKEPGAWERRLWYWHDVNAHWNYPDGESVVVEVYSNCPEVELFLNGRSLGRKQLADFEDRVLRWAVPFSSGQLKAVGYSGGKAVTALLETHGSAAGIELSVDSSVLDADGYAVAHVVAQLVDDKGNPVLSSDQEVVFSVEGPCSILGVDNGAEDSVQPYQSDRVVTDRGRCLLVIQSWKVPGEIRILASGNGFSSQPVLLRAQ